jgi:hypothetical protein
MVRPIEIDDRLGRKEPERRASLYAALEPAAELE